LLFSADCFCQLIALVSRLLLSAYCSCQLIALVSYFFNLLFFPADFFGQQISLDLLIAMVK
jgi:hypothetical protein